MGYVSVVFTGDCSPPMLAYHRYVSTYTSLWPVKPWARVLLISEPPLGRLVHGLTRFILHPGMAINRALTSPRLKLLNTYPEGIIIPCALNVPFYIPLIPGVTRSRFEWSYNL